MHDIGTLSRQCVGFWSNWKYVFDCNNFTKKNKMKKSARKSKISYFGQEVHCMILGICHDNVSYFGQIGNISCNDFTKKKPG